MAGKQKKEIPEAWQTWRSIKGSGLKRLALLVEAGFQMEQERKAKQALADAVGEEIRGLKDYLIKTFDKAQLNEIKTKLGTARLDRKDIPVMDPDKGGWDAIYAYIKANDAFDLLNKRLTEKACKARWEAGNEIPGVKKFTKVEVKFGDAE